VRVAAAIVSAIVIAVVFVLPAEFHMDPTGLGARMGLLKMSGPRPPKLDAGAVHNYATPFRADDVTVSILPYGDVEYQVRMESGGTLVYSWKSRAPIDSDFHGESDADPDIAVSFTVGKAAEASGSLVAPFKGTHGWYWQNMTGQRVDVQLKMAGFYELSEPPVE
jgi:hypothetical protein